MYLKKKTDWWDEISEDERQSIEKGLAEADRGELIPHEQVMKELKSRYKLRQMKIKWTPHGQNNLF